jgi:hypothetical protein
MSSAVGWGIGIVGVPMLRGVFVSRVVFLLIRLRSLQCPDAAGVAVVCVGLGTLWALSVSNGEASSRRRSGCPNLWQLNRSRFRET